MSTKKIGWVGLLLALAMALFLKPWSSIRPDGLEWVAQEAGFWDQAMKGVALLAPNGLGGLGGVAVVFCLGLVFGKLLRPGGRTRQGGIGNKRRI